MCEGGGGVVSPSEDEQVKTVSCLHRDLSPDFKLGTSPMVKYINKISTLLKAQCG